MIFFWLHAQNWHCIITRWTGVIVWLCAFVLCPCCSRGWPQNIAECCCDKFPNENAQQWKCGVTVEIERNAYHSSAERVLWKWQCLWMAPSTNKSHPWRQWRRLGDVFWSINKIFLSLAQSPAVNNCIFIPHIQRHKWSFSSN